MATLKSKFYMHSSKDDTYYLAEELGLLDEALNNFRPGYEVTFDIEVDDQTGDVVAVAVNGVPISRPVSI